MNDFIRHPLAMDGKDPANLRGDPIDQEPYLAAQETRVRRFHEVLHDYLNGNPPGRP